MKKIAIIGSGGFAREVAADLGLQDTTYFVEDEFVTDLEKEKPLSKFDPTQYRVLVAIGDPKTRSRIVSQMPSDTQYYTHISKHAIILEQDVFIGEGSIICAGTILTTNIRLGKHTHLNLHTTVGHDCQVGDFLTTAPGVKISGNVEIGDRVYLGTNSSVREKIQISSDVVVGMQGAVVKHIHSPGTYTGVPVKLLEK